MRRLLLVLLIPALALVASGCATDPPGPLPTVGEEQPPPTITDGPPVVAGAGPPGARVAPKDADPMP